MTGAGDYGSLILVRNKLYGTTYLGGAYDSGCVFSMDTNGGNYKDIFDFNGTNGIGPEGSLTLAGTELFGLTSTGAGLNSGCIFAIDTTGNNYKDIIDFNPFNALPTNSSVIISGEKIFCVTFYGGIHDSGSIFSVDTNGTTYKDLFDFNGVNGAGPVGPLVLSGNTLFGSTEVGGGYRVGAIFSMDTAGKFFTRRLDFKNTGSPEGEYPSSLILSGSTLYGMAYAGGANGAGVVYKFDTNSIDTINKTSTLVHNIATNPASIDVYPNPSNGVFTIQANNQQAIPIAIGTNSYIEVYNVLGEKVYSNSYQPMANSYQVSLSNQPNGVYLYRIITQSGQLAGEGKIEIQK
jgi:uncharacterized repeat protein (TIGR03803 family)